MGEIHSNTTNTTDPQLLRLMKKQLFWQRLTGLLLALLIGGTVCIIPKVKAVGQNLEILSSRANAVMGDLEILADGLIGLDLEGLLESTDQLISSSEKNMTDMTENVGQALKKLEDLDVDSFNEAIGRLNTVAGRLSSLFGGR